MMMTNIVRIATTTHKPTNPYIKSLLLLSSLSLLILLLPGGGHSDWSLGSTKTTQSVSIKCGVPFRVIYGLSFSSHFVIIFSTSEALWLPTEVSPALYNVEPFTTSLQNSLSLIILLSFN